jgi:hypothetical protein
MIVFEVVVEHCLSAESLGVTPVLSTNKNKENA